MKSAACTMGAMGFLATAGHAQGPDDDTAYLKQRVFRIPIEVASDKNDAIRELRLFVSSDRGSSWTRVATVPPSQRSFTFRARVDGEYWFGLAYVDEAGNVEPTDMRSQEPGLKVVVDTAPPVLQLRPAPRTPNGAGVEWRVLDDHPVELGTLQMEVRDKREGQWQELYPEAMLEGTVDWPASPDQAFVLRATIKDQAGNVGTAEIEIVGSPAMSSMPTGPAPSMMPVPNPVQSGPSNDPLVPPPPSIMAHSLTPQPGPEQPMMQQQQPMMAQQPAAMPQQMAAVPNPQGIPRTTTLPTNEQLPPPSAYTTAKPPTYQQTPVPQMTPPAPATAQPTFVPTYPAAVAAVAEEPEPARLPSPEPIASTSVPVRQVVHHTTRKPAPEPPPAQRIPLVGNTHFAVDYALRGIGPAGVGKVELFYTKDNGVMWNLLGEDADRTPPFEVELPGEGRYGLAIVVTSPAGNGQRPPQAGDAPTIQVEVDTTAPEAQLFRPIPDPEMANALLIRWGGAHDLHMPERPVRLYYSPTLDGNWEPIATDLPAEGSYSWVIPPGTPYQVYLRLVISDMCNNTSEAVTPEPVMIDLSKPEAEVIGIAILPSQGPAR